VGLKLNGTQQLLHYADDVNLLEDNMDIIKENRGTLIETSKEFVLEVKTDETKHMFLSRHRNAEQNHYIKITTMF
jgi:hypothetical protein